MPPRFGTKMRSMRWNWILIFSLFTAAGCGAGNSPSPAEAMVAASSASKQIATLHFIGGEKIAADTNSTFLKTIWAMPETKALVEQTLNKLAHVPYEVAQRHGIRQKDDFIQKVRPLLDDLAQNEWLFEAQPNSNGPPELVLAVHLSNDRNAYWMSAAKTALESWTGMTAQKFEQADGSGWELRKHHAPNLLQWVRLGEWTILGAGENEMALADKLKARIKMSGRPCPPATNYWMEAEGDWPDMAKCVTWPIRLPLPEFSRVHVTVNANDGNVRMRVVASSVAPLAWHSMKWQVPTNLIREPLISFMAAQGIGKWLREQKRFQFQLQPQPDEVFIWASKGAPFQTFISAPFADAREALDQIAPEVMSLNTNLPWRMAGQIGWDTNQTAIVWHGLPFIVPFISAVYDTNEGDFLFAGIFPNLPRLTPLPSALLEQVVGKTNLVYYHWEITAERMIGWRAMSQLFLLLSGYEQLAGKSVAAEWLNAVSPRLGNAVTEATVTSPNELTLIRKSPIGFTAAELTLWANWLETTNFPFDKPFVPMQSTKAIPPTSGKRESVSP